MEMTRTTERPLRTTLPDVDVFIRLDPQEAGRHRARFIESGTPVHAVLNALGLGNRPVDEGDVATVAREWHLSEEEVRAAVAYYVQNRDLWDAFFLLQEEENG